VITSAPVGSGCTSAHKEIFTPVLAAGVKARPSRTSLLPPWRTTSCTASQCNRRRVRSRGCGRPAHSATIACAVDEQPRSAPAAGCRPRMSCKTTQRRSVRLPHGYAPLHFWGNQRSGRRAAAQGACNRPMIKHPFIFIVSSGQRGEPPRKNRANAPRLSAPSAPPQLAVQLRGLGPHVM
jgi:hypothetical protein